MVSQSYIVDRANSVSLRIPAARIKEGISPTRSELLNELSAYAPAEAILCVQKLSNSSFDITLKSGFELNKERMLIEGLTFNGLHLDLQEATAMSSNVTVKNLPAEIPEAIIKESLAPYGTVTTITKTMEEGIWNGDRVATMKLKSEIPSLIKVGRYPAFIRYRGQRLCCHYCNNWGHTVAQCQYKRDGLCIRCGEKGHVARKCNKAWVSAAPVLQAEQAGPSNAEFPELQAAPNIVTTAQREGGPKGTIARNTKTTVTAPRPAPPPPTTRKSLSSASSDAVEPAISNDTIDSSESPPPNQEALLRKTVTSTPPQPGNSKEAANNKRAASPPPEKATKKSLVSAFEGLIPCSAMESSSFDMNRIVFQRKDTTIPESANPFATLAQDDALVVMEEGYIEASQSLFSDDDHDDQDELDELPIDPKKLVKTLSKREVKRLVARGQLVVPPRKPPGKLSKQGKKKKGGLPPSVEQPPM